MHFDVSFIDHAIFSGKTDTCTAFYSRIFEFFSQEETSVYVTTLWKTDPFKAKWTIVARAYASIRDLVGEDNAPLIGFLDLVCPAFGIIAVNKYLKKMNWTIKLAADDTLDMHQAALPDLDAFEPSIKQSSMTEMDVIWFCGVREYIDLQATTTLTGLSVAAQPRQGLLAGLPGPGPLDALHELGLFSVLPLADLRHLAAVNAGRSSHLNTMPAPDRSCGAHNYIDAQVTTTLTQPNAAGRPRQGLLAAPPVMPSVGHLARVRANAYAMAAGDRRRVDAMRRANHASNYATMPTPDRSQLAPMPAPDRPNSFRNMVDRDPVAAASLVFGFDVNTMLAGDAQPAAATSNPVAPYQWSGSAAHLDDPDEGVIDFESMTNGPEMWGTFDISDPQSFDDKLEQSGAVKDGYLIPFGECTQFPG
jgi:hypothetical protein